MPYSAWNLLPCFLETNFAIPPPKKKNTNLFITKFAKNRHNCLQYKIFSTCIFWILPYLAKYNYGWLSLEQHHKIEWKIKNKIKIPALLFLFGVKFPVLSGYLNFQWTVGFWIFQTREPSVLWSKIQNYTYSKKFTYTDIYSQSLNTHLLDLLLSIGCTVIWIFKEPSISVFFKTFQNQRTAVPSYSKSLEEPAVLMKELVTNKSWFSWLVMLFFSISENHGYIPTPGLWFLRTPVLTPNNLPDNRRGVCSCL